MTKPVQGAFSKLRLYVVISSVTLLTACATTANKTAISTLYKGKSDLKVLLMPLDVELSLLTASGLQEPRADWTAAAKKHMQTSLSNYQRSRGAKLIQFEDTQNINYTEIQRLHNAVGTSILVHEFLPAYKLPSKSEKFDWTLGSEVSMLKEQYDADYALFIFVRDSYSSSDRVALTVVAALLGVALRNAQQIGFASLVDLNTGKIAWFNKLHSTTGDLRTEESADTTVTQLLAGLPQ